MDKEELFLQSKVDVVNMYLNSENNGDWAVMFSGGKDSTCVLSMVVSVLEGLPKEMRYRKVHVVMSDTEMENPNLVSYMHDQIRLIQQYADNRELPITTTIVKRPITDSYFYLTMGKGYFLPHNSGKGRWCTDKLKIRPTNIFLRELRPSNIIVGTRTSESMQRERSINKHRIGYKTAKHAILKNTDMFMPIVDWTIEDVWYFLSTVGVPWGTTYEVRRLYKEATGECGFTNPRGAHKNEYEACGARFGCWNCPVVRKDRSTEQMSQTHEWMIPLVEWRKLQLMVYGVYRPNREDDTTNKQRTVELADWREKNEGIKLITKSGYGRKGQRLKDGQGCLTIEAREYLLDSLLSTQIITNRLRSMKGLLPLELISQEEIDLIHKQWNNDLENHPQLKTNQLGYTIKDFEKLID